MLHALLMRSIKKNGRILQWRSKINMVYPKSYISKEVYSFCIIMLGVEKWVEEDLLQLLAHPNNNTNIQGGKTQELYKPTPTLN